MLSCSRKVNLWLLHEFYGYWKDQTVAIILLFRNHWSPWSPGSLQVYYVMRSLRTWQFQDSKTKGEQALFFWGPEYAMLDVLLQMSAISIHQMYWPWYVPCFDLRYLKLFFVQLKVIFHQFISCSTGYEATTHHSCTTLYYEIICCL